MGKIPKSTGKYQNPWENNFQTRHIQRFLWRFWGLRRSIGMRRGGLKLTFEALGIRLTSIKGDDWVFLFDKIASSFLAILSHWFGFCYGICFFLDISDSCWNIPHFWLKFPFGLVFRSRHLRKFHVVSFFGRALRWARVWSDEQIELKPFQLWCWTIYVLDASNDNWSHHSALSARFLLCILRKTVLVTKTLDDFFADVNNRAPIETCVPFSILNW